MNGRMSALLLAQSEPDRACVCPLLDQSGHLIRRLGQVNAAAHASRALAHPRCVVASNVEVLSPAVMGKLSVAELPVLP
jgi:hypothetical protein